MSQRLRNELITQAYGDIAESMATVLGHENATWCSIGQWASSSIGDYLDLPVPRLGKLITRAFGDGNRDVFADIGRAHVTFLETVGYAALHDADLDEAWARCEAELRVDLPAPPSQPLPAAHTTSGVLLDGRLKVPGLHRRELLIRAFLAYREALVEPEEDIKARLILLGNSLLALHEQKQLGPAIAAGFRTWLRHLTTFWRILQTPYRWRNSDPKSWRLKIEGWWIRTATKRFVKMRLPDRTLRVGDPLPTTPYAVRVPPSLTGANPERAALADVPSLLLLSILFESFAVDGRASTCWADLNDRMAFILAIFANEQRSPAMLTSAGTFLRPEARPDLVDDLRRLRDRVERLLPPLLPPEVAVHDDELLDSLRLACVVELVAAAESTHQGVHHVEHDHDTADFHHDFELRVNRVCGPGRLIDAATAARAQRTFDDWSVLLFTGLLFRALPDAYAARRGVRVLGEVSDLATNPVRRVGETAHFLRDLLGSPTSWTADGLSPDGPAVQSLRGVRVIHAIISQQLMARDWDHADLGLPINHEDVLGTMLSFFVPSFEMLEELGAGIADDERDAYARFWCGIGHLMGLPYDVVTVATTDLDQHDDNGRRALDYAESLALSRKIRARHHERSLDGVRLAEALVEGVADGFPRFSDWIAVGLFDVLGAKPVNNLLLLGERRARKRAAILGRSLNFLLRWRLTRDATRRLARIVGQLWLEPFLDEGAQRPFRRLALVDPVRAPVLEQPEDYWPLGCGVPRP